MGSVVEKKKCLSLPHTINSGNTLSSQRCQFVKNYFFGIKHFHANVQCVFIVQAKYQTVSSKAQVDFQAYVLSMHMPYRMAFDKQPFC